MDKMIDASSIDNSKLIGLIEKMPVLWDKHTEFYKNRAATQTAWKYVLKALNPEYMAWDDPTRKAYVKLIMRRWTHLRDNYYRSVKKLQEHKLTGARPTKPYLYSKKLAFLEKILKGNDSVNNVANEKVKTEQQDDDSDSIDISEHSLEANDIRTINSTPDIMHLRPSHTEDNKISYMDSTSSHQATETNRHLSFFKGILPSLDNFDDNETIDFQMGVLKLLKKIRSGRQSQQFPSFNIKSEDPSSSHDGFSSS